MIGPRDTIKRLLNQALANATDDMLRGEMQQKRMPFDHDNNDAQIKRHERIGEYMTALAWMENERLGV
jgi:hypothetical protein